jgi:hypothetical protein
MREWSSFPFTNSLSPKRGKIERRGRREEEEKEEKEEKDQEDKARYQRGKRNPGKNKGKRKY